MSKNSPSITVDTSHDNRRAAMRHFAKVVALAAVYFCSGKLGLRLAFLNQSATAVWPPTGIALAALLLFGYRVWPGIWLGAFLVNLTTAGTVLTSIGIAGGNTLEALLATWLVQQFANGRNAFERTRDIFMYILLAAVLSTTVSATFGVTSLALGGFARWHNYPLIWVTWWLGDMVSALTVTPLLVIWATSPRPRLTRQLIAEATLLLASVLLVGLLTLGNLLPRHLQWPFLCFPPLLWAAFRFGELGAITSAFTLSVVALREMIHGAGPFVLSDRNEALLALQTFVGTITMAPLILATVISERRKTDKALRDTKDELHSITDVTAVMLTRCSRDLRYLYANRACADMLGFAPEEIVGKPIVDIIGAEAFQRIRPYVNIVLQGQPVEYEMEIPYRTLGRRFMRVMYVPDKDRRGNVVGWVTSITDITERKQAEKRLTANLAITRILAESPALDVAMPRVLQTIGETLGWTVGAAWIQDSETKTLRCLNVWHDPSVKAERFQAVSRELTFAPGVGLPGRVWTSWKPAWIPDVTKDDNFPRASAATADGLHGAFAFPIVYEGKFLAVMEFFSHEIRQPDEALLAMFSGVGNQLGQFLERKRGEEALAENEDRFRILAEAATDAIVTIDENSIIKFVNAAAERTFGYTRQELLGAELTMLMPEAFHQAHLAGFQRYRGSGRRGGLPSRAIEFPGRHKDGHEIPLEISFGEFVQGGQRFFAGVIRDITERKRQHDAQQLLVDASAVLASSLDYQTTLTSLARLVVPQIADWCTIYMPSEGTLRLVAMAHADPSRTKWAHEMQVRFPPDLNGPTRLAKVLRTGKPELVPDLTDAMLQAAARSPEHLALLRELGLKSCLVVPMIAQGRTIGAITFLSAQSDRRYDEKDLTWAQELSRRAALAVENAQLFAATREQAQAIDAILSASVDYVSVLDREGRCRYVSHGLAASYGLQPRDMIGKTPREIGLPADVVARGDEIRKKVIATGRPAFGETIRMLADGEHVFEYILAPVLSATATVEGFVAVSRDVTERHQAEETRAHLAAIVESSEDAVLSKDLDGIIMSWNTAAERLFGYTAAEIIGQPALRLIPADRHAEEKQILSKLRRCDHLEHFETVRVTKSGQQIPVSLTISPMKDTTDKVIGASHIARDITERKAAQEKIRRINEELEDRVVARTAELTLAHEQLQAEIDERKRLEAEIAGAIEHEQQRLGQELHDNLGQQLTGIGYLTSALQEKLRKVSPARAREAKRLHAMIQQSVEQTRVLAKGFYPVELEKHGLLFALEEIGATTKEATDVVCQLESDGHPAGTELRGAVAIQLFRIAQEAVLNAVKHANTKRLLIRLAVTDDHVALTVRDYGVGLPSRVDNATGMGLRIMRYRARMVGGNLDIRNADKGGSIVTCSVPLKKRSSATRAGKSARGPTPLSP